MEIAQGSIIGNYRILRPLGKGGMGTVYEVEHVKLGVRYALKAFDVREGEAELFRTRFAAEGKILARLVHPNVVRVFDLDFDERTGTPYYVMDLVASEDGQTKTLASVEPGSVDEDTLAGWFADMCAALDYVHSQGVVHRDVKLGNILVAPDGHAVLSDFGISRVGRRGDACGGRIFARRRLLQAAHGRVVRSVPRAGGRGGGTRHVREDARVLPPRLAQGASVDARARRVEKASKAFRPAVGGPPRAARAPQALSAPVGVRRRGVPARDGPRGVSRRPRLAVIPRGKNT